jgi:hypothetical protein
MTPTVAVVDNINGVNALNSRIGFVEHCLKINKKKGMFL